MMDADRDDCWDNTRRSLHAPMWAISSYRVETQIQFEHEGEGGPNLLFEPCHELLCLVGQLAS